MLSLGLSAQTFTTLFSFRSLGYGASDTLAGVIAGPEGVLYGISAGGARWDMGTVYELMPPSSPGAAWTQTVLHSFNSDARPIPHVGLVMGPNGTLYGAAGYPFYVTAFRLDPPTGTSTGWAYAVIYQFSQTDGIPSGGLVFGPPVSYGQSLYGVTQVDGGNGAVYRLTPPPVAGGAWTHTTLYTFPGGTKGSSPAGNLAVGAGGTIFGVTIDGGATAEPCTAGCGTVFSLAPPTAPGGPWTEGVLHAFEPQIDDGYEPQAGVLLGPGGILYGTTAAGGAGAGGIVFSLVLPAAPGAPMTETILHAFVFSADGKDPLALVLGPDGVLYGTTEYAASTASGIIFALMPPASPGGSWTETILHSFTNGADGGSPDGLTLGPDGTLYGTNNTGGAHGEGTVFALMP